MSAAAERLPRPADECAFERAFERVHRERMATLPFVNRHLRVEALDFRDWQGVRVGALVTPWSINLLVAPAPGAALPAVRPGDTHAWSFPSGEYGFDAHEDPELGRYHQYSLFSPVLEFDDHDEAVAVARAALVALFASPEPARLSRRGLLLGG
ncbi:MAG: [NiFe]-hydrogenase assembly chaperone HybE [Proteobacteria bacterium]|nr:[NiFe]-hydrogenase assembly chaperone HybE [Pseudomonadota bacterium]